MDSQQLDPQLAGQSSAQPNSGMPSGPHLHNPKASKGKTFLMALLVIVAILVIGFLILKSKVNTPLSNDTEQQTFTITKGEKIQSMGNQLYSQGLISNADIFDAYIWYSGQRHNIQAGTYILSPNMSIKQIVQKLSAGQSQSQINVVTIIPGWDLSDISKSLVQNTVVDQQTFQAAQRAASAQQIFGEKIPTASLEGYLYPDTYFISKNQSAAAQANSLISKALDNLQQKVTDQMVADAKSQNLDMYKVLTMASIIEKEVKGADDRKIVAGIFYNRLKVGMPLQSDATVTYLTGKHDSVATSSIDRSIDSPYNTYKYKGLPPGPICSPSISAIQAAIYPTDTDYMYFLTKPDGTPVYAKTAQEQLANEQKYLR